MALAYADIKDRVVEFVRIPNEKLNKVFDFDKLIDRVIEDYSRERPLEKTVNKFGDGTSIVTVPTDWRDGFSELKEIEFPIDNVPRTYLDHDDGWTLEKSGTTTRILLLRDTPGATEVLRLYYTTQHTISTLSDSDLGPAIYLTCERVCVMMAAYYANTTDATLPGDLVNFRDLTLRYQDLAKHYHGLYLFSIGKGDAAGGGVPAPGGGGGAAVKPAFAQKDLDVLTSFGRQRIWHGGIGGPR